MKTTMKTPTYEKGDKVWFLDKWGHKRVGTFEQYEMVTVLRGKKEMGCVLITEGDWAGIRSVVSRDFIYRR